MNQEVFAEWLGRQGHRVYKTESSFWFDQGPKALQAFPYHWIIQPNEAELDELVRDSQAITLRYSTPISAPEGQISYHAMLLDKSYSIEKLGKWARKNVRRGLSKCSIEEISFRQLADEGYELQIDTLDRQGRGVRLSRKEWEIRCISAQDLPGFKAWGAFVDGIMAASVITFSMNNCIYMLYQQCLRQYLELHVNNAIGFTVTTKMMTDTSVDCILYGLHSLDAPASVDEFKFRMGYDAIPVRQRVYFSPMIRPLINNFSHSIVKLIRNISRSNPIIAKTEGMVRFYQDGKQPLDKQVWPEPLSELRDSILHPI